MHARSWLTYALLIISIPLSASPTDELLRRQTQELYDAIGSGSATVWERYVQPDVSFTSEDGELLSKAHLVEQTKPFPAGILGSIRVIDFHVTLHASVAVTTYVADEHENFHGHDLHCQYRSTDTWLNTQDDWRLIASQVLALRTDPPSIPMQPQQLKDYAGRYALSPEIAYQIRQSGGTREGQEIGRKAEPLLMEAPDVLFVPGKPRYRRIFLRGPDGQIQGFAERREEWQLIWKRLPESPTRIP